MPIEFEEPQSLLISENFKPSLTLTFSRELTNNEKQQFSCFVSGQDQPELIWLTSNKVNVQARESLPRVGVVITVQCHLRRQDDITGIQSFG